MMAAGRECRVTIENDGTFEHRFVKAGFALI